METAKGSKGRGTFFVHGYSMLSLFPGLNEKLKNKKEV